MDPGGVAGMVTGKGGAKLIFGDTTQATRLLTIPGGSYLEVQQLYLAAGVDAARVLGKLTGFLTVTTMYS